MFVQEKMRKLENVCVFVSTYIFLLISLLVDFTSGIQFSKQHKVVHKVVYLNVSCTFDTCLFTDFNIVELCTAYVHDFFLPYHTFIAIEFDNVPIVSRCMQVCFVSRHHLG